MSSRYLALADALRLAINVLRDAAESRSMPSGFEMDAGLAQLHADAAEVLEVSLQDLKENG
ncbi:hypothetical protein [Caballeronia sp. GAWG1-1]|uniref:hypothetical protein n=1 Tax=Caballeronia sp. GAWG1-1 TaxID=2921742 RepID=UPI00202926A9|nr:hypothetical protein [Caballeronia sp. GAWG1-1]